MATSNSEHTSAYGRALDALLSDVSVREEDLAQLTGDEKSELMGLARTARLTRLTLGHPEPTQELEAEALARAQEKLARVAPRMPLSEPQESFTEKLRHFFSRGRS